MNNPIKNKKIHKLGLATGVYDVLHVGHINFLKSAKAQCDKLIVGINSDAIVRKYKGDKRPINSQENRKLMLESLRFVDEVFIFDIWEVAPIVAKVQPDIYFITDGDPGEEVKVKVAKKYKAKLVKLKSYNEKSQTDPHATLPKRQLPLCPFFSQYFKKVQNPKYAFAKMSATDIIQKLESLGH